MFLNESWRKINYTIYIRDHLLMVMKSAAQLYINYINPSILTSSEYKIDWQKTFHLYHFPSEFDMHPKRRQALQENDKTITRSPPVLVYPLQVRINPFSNIYLLMKSQDGPIQFIPNKFIYIFGNAKKNLWYCNLFPFH